MHSIPLDVTYQLPERADLYEAVRLDRTDLLPWEREFFDCEAFAMALPYLLARDYGINSVGLVIDATGGHAYNIAVVAGGDVVFIEPQGAPGDPAKLSETYYEPEAFPVDASHRLERGWIIL